MGADKYWKNKAFGRLLSALGGFPVTRGTADREALKRCIAVLEARRAAGAVPRGRAQERRPIVQPLFDGATYIAVKAGVPIVPVGIGGSERAMPKGAKFIFPRKVHVVVGKPIQVPVEATTGEGSARRGPRADVELHAELQRLFDHRPGPRR